MNMRGVREVYECVADELWYGRGVVMEMYNDCFEGFVCSFRTLPVVVGEIDEYGLYQPLPRRGAQIHEPRYGQPRPSKKKY